MIPKRKGTHFLLVLAFILILGNYLEVNAQPTITSISTSLADIVTAYGSIEGGTYVYIKGSGFSSLAPENIVKIGPYPCSLLADGARQDGLSCQTSRAYDELQRWSLPVSVQVQGSPAVICTTSACKFTYTDSKTPFIEQIFPRTATGDQQISIWGRHRITDPGDQRSNGAGEIRNLLIDNIVCSTLDVVQQDAINPDYRDYLRCKTFKDQEAGEYSFTEQVFPGYAKYDVRTVQTSFLTGNNYTQRIAPKITSLPYHVGGNKGHQIEIKGTGFSQNSAAYECTIAGQACTVKNINPTKVTVVVPPVTAGNTAFGALTKDAADSQTQQNNFLGSNGFKYTRYTMVDKLSTSQFFTLLRGANNLTVEADEIRTQLRSPQSLQDGMYVEYWRGYFYAAVNGEYRFAGIADDAFKVQLSSVQSSSNIANLQDLIYNGYSGDDFNPYYSGVSTAIANKTLAVGYYYMEIVSANYGGSGDFRLMVDMPQIHTFTANPTWQVDEITIIPEAITPQILQIKITKTAMANGTSFSFSYFESSTVFYGASITYGASVDAFKYELGSLPYYGNYNPTVTLITKDSTGAVTATPSAIDSYTYRLSYDRYRNPITMLREFYSTKATFTRVQNHSRPITGNYSIKVGALDLAIYSSVNKNFSLTNIPFNTESWTFQEGLNLLYTTDKIQVRTMQNNDFDDSIKFVIQYVGILTDPLPLSINISGLTGGNNNLFTTSYTVKRGFNIHRPLYSPLPYDFMRTAESQPQLYLRVNHIPAVCSNCAYSFNATKTPAVTAASLSTDTLTLTVSDAGSVGFVFSDLLITLNGERCNQISGTLSSLTCKFNQNSLLNAALPAGNNKPIIHVAQVGYADLSAISAINIPLTITSVSPSVSGTNGGIQATIIGTGFPISDKSQVRLSLCGNTVTNIISVSNEQIVFLIPKAATTCTPGARRLLQTITSSLVIGSISQSITTTTFNYDGTIIPVVSSLSIVSSSPIVKSTLVITGANFTTLGATRVFLVNSTGYRSYQLTVNTVTSTSIQCILGGGRTGTYNVVVLDSNSGQSTINANTIFKYELIIQSITPTSGSLGGGYDITITGRNFGQKDTHTVFVGNAENAVCKIVSATPTQIVCTVPRIDVTYIPGTPVNVVVTARLTEQSTCTGTCGFTYDAAVTNNVTVPAVLEYGNGSPVTITGTDLTNAVVTVGAVTVTLTSSNSTSLSFNYPAIFAGQYEIKIMTPTGYTHPAIVTKTLLGFGTGVSRTSGSLNGHRLSLTANGLPTAVDQYLAVNLICLNYSQKLTIIEVIPNKITFETTPSLVDQQCKLNFTYQTTFKTFNYNYMNTQTYNSSVSQSTGNTHIVTSTASVDTVWFQYLSSQNTPTSTLYPATVTKVNSTGYSVVPTGGYLPNGKYRVLVHTTNFGYHTVTPATFTKTWAANPTFTAVDSSFIGGKLITLTGAGFLTQGIQNNQIQVCGLKSKITQATQTSLTLSVPALVTATTQTLYNLAKPSTIIGTLISDNPTKATNVLDGKPSTAYTSPNATCFIGFNFGSNAQAVISYIKYMPNPAWPIAAAKLENAKFQGSNDNLAWSTIFTVDTQQVHSGWNYWAASAASPVQYQYIRFSHTNVSNCQLSEIQFNGIIYSTLSVVANTDKQCDIVIKGPTDVTLANAVNYAHTKTSTITNVSPAFGSSIGGTTVTITGTNFGSALTVTIDGINCPVSSNTATTITCVTGRRSSIPASNSFVVTSDGNPVLVQTQPYNYIDRWSSQDTWGGQSIPRQGDSVYVPKGMSLLVDVASTPILDSIIVQGRIIFADQIDMTLDAHYFIISGGQFVAGTQTNRYQHKLTITLHGGYYDKQLPIFGNKVLGCRNCKFSLHGKVRNPTWTELSATITVGATSFTVLEAVDWQAGQIIVVASSSFDHYESEQRKIASVSADGLTITVTEPFKYRHYSAVQTYGGVDFPMRAEVGLLTRNIKIQGDDSSVDTQYGSHMMMNGKKESGLVASFSYVEITKCGQPKIVGRYCSHFHMAGEMPESSVRGIAVHHSYARVLTIHGTHFLLVEKNVGYFVKGHNIFIQDGIETNNVIQDNLMISSITSLTLLQSDISVASYWVTNPYNTFRRNHAAGSDFYGIWYEIKEHPDGPSATSDICPMGMLLGESKDNVAHSNVRFGLRIFKLSARKYPCISTQLDHLEDPYSYNTPVESVFENYTLWQNAESGFLGEELGYTTIKNFKTADSKKGGLQFHKTNFTKQLVVAQDCMIVGFSQGNAPSNIDVEYNQARGFIASRTDGLKASGIKFYNFGSTMTPLQSCSECYSMKLWVVGSKTTMFERITYTNVTGNYIFWQKWRRQIFMDLDGSLLAPAVTQLGLTAQLSGSITPYRGSLNIPTKCHQITGPLWNHSTYCDSTIQLRSILFTNGIPAIDFNAIGIKAHLLTDPYENFTETQPLNTTFSQELMIVIKPKSKDIPKSWAMPFAVNRYYNIHWKWGIDFTHMAIAPSRLWNDTEGVVLRFNYTDNRELFEIGHWYKQSLQLPLIIPSSSLLDPTTCLNGEYYNNATAKYLFLCVSGRNKKIHQWIDVNGIRCRYNCPQDAVDGIREDKIRLWSDVTNWPNNVLPVDGDNVTIPYEWKMVVNILTPKLNYIEINGILMFDVSLNHTFQAHYIWVRKGIMKIGSPDAPYTNTATIILHGQKSDNYLVLDPDASGNKMLAVTGQLQFYGKVINNTWTKLTSIAAQNATTINVISSANWNVGDKIVIGPTYSGQAEDQVVTITNISGNTVTFTPALQFEHYGAAAPIQNQYGVLDTRAGVGLLTRNIRITKGPDANGWGCRVHVYSYADIPEDPAGLIVNRTGKITFDGVEVDSCGQYDSTYAAIRLQKLGNYVNNYDRPSIITRSSIHNSNGMGMWIANSTNVKVDNNILHYAKKFLIYAEFVDNYTITNNLLVGAKKRPEVAGNLAETVMVDDVACYEQYQPINFATDNVTVTNNLAQGSETGEGFVFPFAPCDKLDTYNFGGNTAGSCTVGFMFHKLQGFDCIGASKMVGYANYIGLMANPSVGISKMIYQDVIFADNQRGITLRYGHDFDDNTMVLRNSYFAGYSRPDCTSCYSFNTIKYCRNGYAIRMFAATISGQPFPLAKKNTGFDVICTRQSYDMKSFLNNVTFENYKQTNAQVPYCQDMSVFRRHDIASDSTGSAYITNSPCLNCDQNAWAWFQKPNTAWRGWFGGCGELDCTGPNNYLVYDQDGSFTGRISQILSNNSMIGDKESSCTFNSKMNGYYCLTDSLAVLEYESIAPDFNKRIMWPIFLKYDTGNWTSTTNGWREWDWMGPEPLNQRLARFVSVVKVRQNYNLTYSSQPPSDSRFQIQKRLLPTGNDSDWIIVRIYYPLPNALEVLVKNTTGTDIIVKPFVIQNGVPVDLRNHVGTCGANNFHFENGTIQFVVNGNSNCQVRVRLSSYVKLTARLSIPVMDFYNNNGPTTFITNICAFLNIDPGRLKIVGIKNGSIIVQSIITVSGQSLATSTQASTDPNSHQALLTQLASNISTALSDGTVSVGAPILGVSTEIYTFNQNGTIYTPDTTKQTSEQKTKTTLIIILATAIPIALITMIVLGYCYIKRRRERIVSINGESNSALSDDNGMHKSKVQMVKVSEMPFEITKMSDTYDKY